MFKLCTVTRENASYRSYYMEVPIGSGILRATMSNLVEVRYSFSLDFFFFNFAAFIYYLLYIVKQPCFVPKKTSRHLNFKLCKLKS